MHRDAESDTKKTSRCKKHADVHTRSMFLDQMETIKRHQQVINSAISMCSTATSTQSILEGRFQFAPTLKTSSSCPLGSHGRFPEAAPCFRISGTSSAEGADIIYPLLLSLLGGLKCCCKGFADDKVWRKATSFTKSITNYQ